jgi:hypothetical protein
MTGVAGSSRAAEGGPQPQLRAEPSGFSSMVSGHLPREVRSVDRPGEPTKIQKHTEPVEPNAA